MAAGVGRHVNPRGRRQDAGREGAAVCQLQRAWDLQPEGLGCAELAAGPQEEKAVLHASVHPHGNGDRARAHRHQAQHAVDVACLQAGLGTDGEDGLADHPAGDGHVAGGQALGVEGHHALAGAVGQVAQGAGRHGREVGVLVGQDVAGGGEAERHAGVALAHDGHDLVADVGTQVVGVGVRVVLAPDDAPHAEKVAELLVGAVQEGPDHSVAAARDGGEAGRAGAAHGVHEEGLGAVVGGVGREDAGGGARRAELRGELVCQAGGLGVANLPAGVLHVALGRAGGRRP